MEDGIARLVRQESDPVFVIGFPRSGTTLLLDYLLSSGAFATYQFGETHFFSHYYRRYGNLRDKRNLATFVSDVRKSDWIKRSGLTDSELLAIEEEATMDYGTFFAAVMGKVAEKQGRSKWVEKTPWHILYVKEIKAAMPRSKFILIVRDPRDVVMSIYNYGWTRGRLAGLVRTAIAWKWHMRKVEIDLKEFPDDVIRVSYEQLVRCPEETGERLSNFLGVNVDWQVVRKSSRGVLNRPNSSYKGEERANPLDRWKSVSDKRFISVTECAVGDNLVRFGYAESGLQRPVFFDRVFIKAVSVAYSLSKQFRQSLFPICRK